MALQSPPPAIPFEWTRANTQHFIELLKEHPSVWNIKSKQYKMRNVRSASLETIKSDLSNFANCTLRVEDITKKLHTLKTQFNREMSAIKASQKSGAGTDDIYTPKLWCFDELRFLADGEPRPSMSNLDEGETTTAQIDVVATLPSQEDAVESPDISLPPTPSLTSACSVATSRTPSPLPSSSSGGTSKKRKQIDEIDNMMALAINKLLSLPSPNNREPLLDISKFVDTELKNMSEMQRKLAKKLICDVLHMGDMGDLTREHSVVRVAGSDTFMA
uniref:MADF domain-containing protein n=1 Tax=Scylla olivacea TaxID=85551 RepID=A0A0P4VX69_SCYOL